MRISYKLGIIVALLLHSLPALADDLITNIVSPIASYQYAENFNDAALTNGGVLSPFVSYQFQENFTSEGLAAGGILSPFVSYQYLENFGSFALTNGGILSPFVSYQYYEWPGNGILNLQYSPTVSYYYQFLDAPLLNIISTTRTPTTDESTPAYLIAPPPPPQLMAYHGGIFTTNLASVDPNQMTIILTHGWIPLKPFPLSLTEAPFFVPNGVEDWPTTMAAQLRSENSTANIVAWNWESAAKSLVTDPKQAGGQTPYEGTLLGQALLNSLGSDYSKPIHFIGHSFGTLVNAYAANYLQGANFAGEPISPTPWPAANMQMTLFDEAEVGANKDFSLNSQDLDDLANANVNILTASPYYHPLPKQFAWADNYVSAVGILQSNAANVILINGFPNNAPDPETWFYDFAAFHGYPVSWYEDTILEDGASLMGFRWSFETGGWFSQAPTNGSVFLQTDDGLGLSALTWHDGTNFVNQRIQSYHSGLATAVNNQVPGLVSANGSVNGQIVGALPAFDSVILYFANGSSSSSQSQVRVRPLGLSANDESGNAVVPAYAWLSLFIPTNAISMSFDYVIQGDWQDDSLAAALSGTNVLSIAGNTIQTNVTFSSGSIDVSAFAGQTNEFFIGIVGGTSTNAQLTVENLAFSISLPPSLQAQMSSGNLMVSWPMSAQTFSLQTTTNLADPNSWTTLPNVPAIVNLQNAITNSIIGSQGFYRLIQSQ
jgi:hypothetical protein